MGIRVVLLVVSSLFLTSASAQSVCTRSDSYTVISSYYVQTSYYYSYDCGFWGLSTCSSTSYGSSLRYQAVTLYNIAYQCCYGYHDPAGGINCEPYCENCNSTHICESPFTCVCPKGWTGDICDEDIDECFEGTSGCEQLCTNTNGSYTCSCDEGFALGLDLHSCLGPPENVSLNASSSTWMYLEWEEPLLNETDGAVTSYEVNCTSDSGYYHFASGVEILEHNVPDLAPYSYYTCCVRALTTNGYSSSACSTERTLQDIPGDIPQNISVNNHSAYAVFIEWQPPLVPNGIITLYTIYANYNNGSSDQFSVNATERSYKLSGLSPHQLIGISISASTAIGEGSISSPILERTSQEVPSEVTDFTVTSLSPHQLFVSWALPEYQNGILTQYKIVVYNTAYDYMISLYVPYTSTNITVSDGIEPFVPYTVEVSAFTHAGEGVALTQILFSEEGVPSVEPELTQAERTDATSLRLEWAAPSLEELRGFLETYEVVYDVLDTYQCMDLDPQISQTLLVKDTFVTLTGLEPANEYCVEVAAKTIAGYGNYTKFTLPLFTNLLFQVHFYGVHDCPEWVHKDSLEKITDFIDGISLELSKTCNCHIPIEYFTDQRLICETIQTDKVVFQSRLVATSDKNTAELLVTVEEWVATSPHLVVQGVQLSVDEYCSVELSELGDGECVSTTTAPPPPPSSEATTEPTTDRSMSNETGKSDSSSQESIEVPFYAIGGSVGGLLLIVVIAIVTTYIMTRICSKKSSKPQRRSHAHDSFDDRNAAVMENPLYMNEESVKGLPSYDELALDEL